MTDIQPSSPQNFSELFPLMDEEMIGKIANFSIFDRAQYATRLIKLFQDERTKNQKLQKNLISLVKKYKRLESLVGILSLICLIQASLLVGVFIVF
jgi:hypothetical protein